MHQSKSLQADPEFVELAALVRRLNLDLPAFESLIRLSPRQARFVALLAEKETASTSEVRVSCGIGNPSDAARAINRKLVSAGIPVRVLCEVRSYRDQFDDHSILGHWRLVNVGKPAANDPAV